MKIKEDCIAFSDDFWYDLVDGGYLDPEKMLEHRADIVRVQTAIATLKEFRSSCEEQIVGFYR